MKIAVLKQTSWVRFLKLKAFLSPARIRSLIVKESRPSVNHNHNKKRFLRTKWKTILKKLSQIICLITIWMLKLWNLMNYIPAEIILGRAQVVKHLKILVKMKFQHINRHKPWVSLPFKQEPDFLIRQLSRTSSSGKLTLSFVLRFNQVRFLRTWSFTI